LPVCQALRQDGTRCGQSGEIPYFWFKDSHNMFNDQVNICQYHYQAVFGKLMEEETKAKMMVNKLRNEVKTTKHTKKICGRCGCYIDPTESSRKACPRCGEDLFNSKKSIIIDDREERTKAYELISSWSSILNHIRNKKCRICNHPLYDPTCWQCSNPMNKLRRSPANLYSHADSHSYDGKRRTVMMFHTICGRIWMHSTFGFEMIPTTDKQLTFEQVAEQTV